MRRSSAPTTDTRGLAPSGSPQFSSALVHLPEMVEVTLHSPWTCACPGRAPPSDPSANNTNPPECFSTGEHSARCDCRDISLELAPHRDGVREPLDSNASDHAIGHGVDAKDLGVFR